MPGKGLAVGSLDASSAFLMTNEQPKLFESLRISTRLCARPGTTRSPYVCIPEANCESYAYLENASRLCLMPSSLGPCLPPSLRSDTEVSRLMADVSVCKSVPGLTEVTRSQIANSLIRQPVVSLPKTMEAISPRLFARRLLRLDRVLLTFAPLPCPDCGRRQ